MEFDSDNDEGLIWVFYDDDNMPVVDTQTLAIT